MADRAAIRFCARSKSLKPYRLVMAVGELQNRIDQEARHSCLAEKTGKHSCLAETTGKNFRLAEKTGRNACPPDFALLLAMAVGLLFGPGSPTQAAIIWSGDVPSDPSTWTSTIDGYIGVSSPGMVSVDGGSSLASSKGYLGYNSGSTGTATITGTGSKWINTSELYVGSYGSGSLTIEAGGQVSSLRGYLGDKSDSTGTATVTGTGSKWTNSSDLYIGRYGSGALTVEAGGQVSNTNGYLGYYSGRTGTATVTGTGSKWTNSGDLHVGYNGSGALTVTDGGVVTARTLYALLSDLKGNGVITAKGAVLDIDFVFDATHGLQLNIPFGLGGKIDMIFDGTGALGAGYKGTGSLRVAEGITVASAGGYLGYRSGATGMATITGAGSKWTNSGSLYVGYYGSGELSIEAGGQVSNFTGYLTGAVIVTGAGSKWTNNGSLNIGNLGSGVLAIAAGGQVSSTNGFLGYGSQSTATVTGAGSKWTNSSNLYVGFGTLTIEAGGQASNTRGYLGSSSGTSTVTVTGTDSKWTNSNDLYVGETGSGVITITAGGQVGNLTGCLGYYSGSTGIATVTGTGSKWINSSSLYVGHEGNGTLTVEAGGQLSNTIGYLGYYPGSTGTVTVTGASSRWTNSESLYVGIIGSGTLNIRGNGNVTATSVTVRSLSIITIDVGYGSLLSVGGGTGTITNFGKVRIVTGPQVAAGSQYAPIAVRTWYGTYQALGGTWDTTSNLFTVSPMLSGVSGTPVAVDLAQTQRVAIAESAGPGTAAASFLAKTGTGQTFYFTASTLTSADRAALQGLLTPGQSVLSGWNFTAAGGGYVATDPIYLSLSIPANLERGELNLWRLNGGTWSSFAAADLTSLDGYASFTVTGLSGYAVAAAVPEPSVLVLLLASACGVMLGLRRRIG
jgi:T5SS/PEP-CTERM-associated repeat protein